MHNIRWAISASIAAVLTLLPQAGAVGETSFHPDPAGDVVSVAIDAGPNLEHIATLQTRRAHGDIVSMRSLHGHRRVIVGVRFRNIKPTGYMSHDVAFKTDRARYLLSIQHTGRRVQDVSFDKGDAVTVHCGDLKIHVGVRTDRLGISVPRGCLNRPRWVRVGAETFTSPSSGDFDYDDAMRRGRRDANWGFVGPLLGPRLSRG